MFCHVLTSVTTIQHSIHLHAQDLWHTNRQPTIRTTQSLSPNQFFIYRKILSHFIFLTSTLKVVFPLFFLTSLGKFVYKSLAIVINTKTCVFLCIFLTSTLTPVSSFVFLDQASSFTRTWLLTSSKIVVKTGRIFKGRQTRRENSLLTLLMMTNLQVGSLFF